MTDWQLQPKMESQNMEVGSIANVMVEQKDKAAVVVSLNYNGDTYRGVLINTSSTTKADTSRYVVMCYQMMTTSLTSIIIIIFYKRTCSRQINSSRFDKMTHLGIISCYSWTRRLIFNHFMNRYLSAYSVTVLV